MTDRRKTRWECNGMRMRSWRSFSERRRMEGSSSQVQKVPELVVHERMYLKKTKCAKEKKKVKRMVY